MGWVIFCFFFFVVLWGVGFFLNQVCFSFWFVDVCLGMFLVCFRLSLLFVVPGDYLVSLLLGSMSIPLALRSLDGSVRWVSIS